MITIFNEFLAGLCISRGILPVDGIPLEIVEEFNAFIEK
jgi:hypothetical protein